MIKKNNAGRIFTIILFIVILLACIYVMATKKGLVEGLDFGAGAYYYADIPEFEKYVFTKETGKSLPYRVYVILFIIWGYLMFLLWKWVEHKTNKIR